MVGLIVGIAGGGSESEAAPATADPAKIADVQSDLDEALHSKADLSDQLGDLTRRAATDSEAAAKRLPARRRRP